MAILDGKWRLASCREEGRRQTHDYYERTKTLLSLFRALLSVAELFLASRSGARSRGSLETVWGLRLLERLPTRGSLSCASQLRREPSVGSGRAAAGAFDSDG